jgi:DNA-binding transcriptional MocR family regulator
LPPDERLSLATATRVYRELEEMGLVSGETGRGTFVRDLSLPPGHGVDQQVVAADVVDLNFNYPSLPAQGDALREALRQLAMAGDIDSHLRYQPHAGRLAERDIIARHLTCQHFAPDAENVLIVNGAQHGLAVTVMGLLRPGDVVAVDALTYSGFKVLAALYHLELAAIPVGRRGRTCRRFIRCASSGGCGRCIPCRRCTIRWAGCSTPGSGRRWPISRASTIC